MSAEPDFIEFVDDGPVERARPTVPPWKVAIVDDDDAVHEGTQFALRDYRLEGRGIELLSAHSAAEGRRLLAEHPDMAVMLLDVVMESEEAGLGLVTHVRTVLGNETVRIILRTGQPGQAPERRVVVDYDINDYKAKTELTADKLFTALTAALRSYEQLRNLTDIRRGLEDVIDSGAELLDARNLAELAQTALGRARRLLGDPVSARLALREEPVPGGETVARSGPADPGLDALLADSLASRCGLRAPAHTAFHAESGHGCQVVLAVSGGPALSRSQATLADLFCARVAVVADNLRLRRKLEDSNADLERCVVERTRNLIAANRRLEAQGQTLRRANAFKNEILGTIAHDLKNPLGVVLGRAQILRELIDRTPLPVEQAEAQLREIGEAGRRLTGMIDNLISNAMMDAVDMTIVRSPLQIAGLVAAVVEANRPSAARKEQALDLTLEAEPLVSGDADRLREAIDNLVDNAIKYTRAGGRIEVLVESDGEQAVVRVRDEGPGLSPEDMRRLFAKFQRLSAKPTAGESSTGLGLSIAKRIVELHGGTVSAENRPGGGAVFSIFLPLEPAEEAA